ncbi:hypothetical protein DENSPDRAFT_779818 [Dentipellis sp. KUC8613]|nr:hypothetical protein DENSPDRAFT_779818 [Dentipellis sp. KUC8613]
MDDPTESYLLLLLSDSNLPTGSFVASAGLESYVAHGFFRNPAAKDAMGAMIAFLRDNLQTYARSSLPFIRDAQKIVLDYASGVPVADVEASSDALEEAVVALIALDKLYETTTLNHVARRASQAQGVALLTLYTKGFVCPPSLCGPEDSDPDAQGGAREKKVAKLVDRLKLLIRREETYGHLPICWAVLVGALGLSIDRGAHLHLFLQARGLLSAAVRMNAIGPYASQQLLLHAVRPLVDAEAAAAREAGLTTGELSQVTTKTPLSDDVKARLEDVVEEDLRGPVTTWPLGEILAARHDLLHSRMFNS